jgi:Ca-activated chloride channel family protein
MWKPNPAHLSPASKGEAQMSISSIRRAVLCTSALLLTLTFLSACDDKKADKGKESVASSATSPIELIRENAKWGHDSQVKAKADSSHLLANDYYFVFDGSGSMSDDGCSGGDFGGRIEPAKRAAIGFAGKLKPEDNLGLYVFDDRGRGERVPLGNGPANRAAFAQAVNAIKAGDGTPLGDSLRQAFNVLKSRAAQQLGYGSYHIVVVTDGAANGDGDPDLMNSEIDEIGRTPVVLETIGFCLKDDNKLKTALTSIYHDATDPSSLSRGLDAVLAESGDFKPDADFTAKP